MNFKKLLELLEKGEKVMDPLSGIIGEASSILNVLGVGRRRQIRQQKEMAENAAKINYKYGEMAAENAFGTRNPKRGFYRKGLMLHWKYPSLASQKTRMTRTVI